MVTAVKQRVTVGADGSVRVQSPRLRPGTEAEVIVLMDDQLKVAGSEPTEPRDQKPRPLSSFFGGGKGSFKSIDEVDAYVRQLRDEWEDRA